MSEDPHRTRFIVYAIVVLIVLIIVIVIIYINDSKSAGTIELEKEYYTLLKDRARLFAEYVAAEQVVKATWKTKLVENYTRCHEIFEHLTTGVSDTTDRSSRTVKNVSDTENELLDKLLEYKGDSCTRKLILNQAQEYHEMFVKSKCKGVVLNEITKSTILSYYKLILDHIEEWKNGSSISGCPTNLVNLKESFTKSLFTHCKYLGKILR